MLPGFASHLTLCGHAEHARGHCAVAGCGNRWQLCAACAGDAATAGRSL